MSEKVPIFTDSTQSGPSLFTKIFALLHRATMCLVFINAYLRIREEAFVSSSLIPLGAISTLGRSPADVNMFLAPRKPIPLVSIHSGNRAASMEGYIKTSLTKGDQPANFGGVEVHNPGTRETGNGRSTLLYLGFTLSYRQNKPGRRKSPSLTNPVPGCEGTAGAFIHRGGPVRFLVRVPLCDSPPAF